LCRSGPSGDGCLTAIAVSDYVAEIGNPVGEDRGRFTTTTESEAHVYRSLVTCRVHRRNGGSSDSDGACMPVWKIVPRTSGHGRPGRAPGDLLIRPLAVVALMVLIVNDHVVKHRWPGPLSGKLSDIAGLVFLPVLVISLCELARAAVRRPWRVGDSGVLAVVTLVAVGFAATKLSTAVSATYGDMLGWLRWPLTGHWSHVAISRDPTDVLCTPAAIVVWIESRRQREVRRNSVSDFAIGDTGEVPCELEA
jgi:hypothetical protein